jgi:transposase
MAEYALWVGVDWGSVQHVACAVDAAGQRVERFRVPHSGRGVAALAGRLLARAGGDATRIAVAVEVPRGALVDALLAHGAHVYTLNPKQLDRFRDRHTVAGAKDDDRDAFVLADALRTDRPRFDRLQPEAPAVVQLRELSRLHDELSQERRRLANRLREQLWRYYPALLALCPGADEPWLWSLLAAAPTPAQGQRLTPAALRAVLARHHIRRLSADALHAALQAPALPVTPAARDAAAEHVALLLPRLELAHAQCSHCDRRLQAVLERLAQPTDEPSDREHRDVTILRSLPGLGRVAAATMLAEASQPLSTRDYQRLRAYAGAAPVTRQSGKTRVVRMRRSCHARVREAVFHWARNSIRLDPHARAHYARLRERHNHARALRGVADRLLRILIAMLVTGTLYDPLRCRPVAA